MQRNGREDRTTEAGLHSDAANPDLPGTWAQPPRSFLARLLVSLGPPLRTTGSQEGRACIPRVCRSLWHRPGAGECCTEGHMSIFSWWFPGTWLGTNWLVFLTQFKFAKFLSVPLLPRPAFPGRNEFSPRIGSGWHGRSWVKR